MRRFINGFASPLLLISSIAHGQVFIDDFSTAQKISAAGVGGMAWSYVSDGETGRIMGGERDSYLEVKSGSGKLTLIATDGLLAHSQAAFATGYSRVEWDGPDSDPLHIWDRGLGGVDLTAGGTQNALRLQVDLADWPVDITFSIYTDELNRSEYVLSLPGWILDTTPFVMPYSAFISKAGSGADFTNVGAIAMEVNGANMGTDVVVGRLDTTLQPTVTPAPTSGRPL